MGLKLSILICHLTKRKPLLDRLMACLQPQLTPEVEVLVEEDQGQSSIGSKRNKLLERATGSWVCYIDDDDGINPNYVAIILKALESNPDCVSLNGLIYQEIGQPPRPFVHSLKYSEWFESGPKFYRNPHHLCPVRRELALKAGFPDISSEEDRRYSERLLPLLKTEVEIPEDVVLYHYYAY